MSNLLELELEKKYLRAQRLKSIKDLEKEYTKELITLYREKVNQNKKEEDFKKVIELYKTKVEEIEYLKNKKKEILEQLRKNEIEKEKSDIILQEYLKEVERKKLDFDNFMKERGKEALIFVKRNKEIKQKLEEELHKYESKKKIKEEMKTKSKYLINNYREKKEKEELENLNEDLDNNINLQNQKIIYQTLGNKIDYSKTRFHNIKIVKHENELNFEDYKISAQEKAKKESEKLKTRKDLNENNLKNFDSKVELNSKEIIRKQKAKDNLNRLEEELNQLNQMRKKSLSKNKMLTTDNMKSQAKMMEKQSVYMMNRILNEKMNNRQRILNDRKNINENINEKIINQNNFIDDESPPEDLSDFYKDNDENDNLNNLDEDNYLNQAILEHNKQIEENNSKLNNNKAKNTFINYYQEPLLRDNINNNHCVKEEISRLNPIDLESFNKNIVNKSDIFNKPSASTIHRNFSNNLINRNNHIIDRNENINIRDYIKSDNSNRIDENSKLKANSLVLEFFNDVNKLEKYNNVDMNKKEKSYLYVEPKINYNLENLRDSNKNEERKVYEVNNNFNDNIKKEEFKKPPQKLKNELFNNDDELNEYNANNFIRDKTKWKYSKQELLERKKKMLKDKSNLKKY